MTAPPKVNVQSSHGFTLLELILVIAIVIALSALSIGKLIGPEKGARDTRRQSELRQYQSALEVYASRSNGLYPIRAGSVTASSLCGSGQPLGSIVCPNDPRSQAGWPNYSYQSDGAGLRYVMWARMEKTSLPIEYHVACSNGRSGKTGTGVPPSGGNCPI